MFEKVLHSPKVTVWCGLSSKKVYGPYFFEDNSNDVCTVTTKAYIKMLETEFSGSSPPEVWFQQDGATSHTSSRAMDWLQSHFGNNLISVLNKKVVISNIVYS